MYQARHLNFRPVFLPRTMRLDPRQAPIPARPPVAMRHGGYHLPPQFLSSLVSSCLQKLITESTPETLGAPSRFVFSVLL